MPHFQKAGKECGAVTRQKPLRELSGSTCSSLETPVSRMRHLPWGGAKPEEARQRQGSRLYAPSMAVSIEDNFDDVVGKAQRGLGLSDSQLADRAGVGREAWAAFKGGAFDETVARAVAPALELNADALVALGRKSWGARELAVPGLAMFNTPYHDMTVNAYLVWDTETKKGIAFDTGADASPMLERMRQEGIALELILLTHTHGDHVLDLDRLMEKTHAPAMVCELEPMAGANTFTPGASFKVAGLTITSRLTCGHSKGGTSYVISGLERPVVIVGDALFAGSMGGGMVSYADALRTNREQLFTLPDDTVICPGHGPLTTLRDEKNRNPFFA